MQILLGTVGTHQVPRGGKNCIITILAVKTPCLKGENAVVPTPKTTSPGPNVGHKHAFEREYQNQCTCNEFKSIMLIMRKAGICSCKACKNELSETAYLLERRVMRPANRSNLHFKPSRSFTGALAQERWLIPVFVSVIVLFPYKKKIKAKSRKFQFLSLQNQYKRITQTRQVTSNTHQHPDLPYALGM